MARADRSDHPSFYDPEHPANQPARAKEFSYAVAVLCDDGETYTWEGWALDREEAERKAWDRALECGVLPVEVTSCELC